MANNKVFVYGTLKRKENKKHHMLLATSRFCGQATAKGCWTFVDLGVFPAVVLPRAGSTIPLRKISGEVYAVSDETLTELDSMEGVPTLYVRLKIQVKGHGDCFIYAMPYNVASRGTPIVGSVWHRTSQSALPVLPPKTTYSGYSPKLPELQWVIHVPLKSGDTAEMQVAAATLWDAIDIATTRATRGGLDPTGTGQTGRVAGSSSESRILLPPAPYKPYVPPKTYHYGILEDKEAFSERTEYKSMNGGW